jgi:hypothetical protein
MTITRAGELAPPGRSDVGIGHWVGAGWLRCGWDDARVSTRVQEAFSETLREAARELEATDAPLKEKHLAAVYRRALYARLRAAETGCAVDAAEHSVELKEWPGVGPVDLVVRTPIGDPLVFVEFKWGQGVLYNCVWDLAKMAVTVARGAAHRACLVAGAPDSDWADALGSELFETGAWTAADLLSRYRQHWEFWRTAVKTRPVLLPVEIQTANPAREALRVAGESWSLRAIDVDASPEDWLDVESGIKASRWVSHFTWEAGDVELLDPAEAEGILKEIDPGPRPPL